MVPWFDVTITLHSHFQEHGENQSASPSAAALLPHFDAPRLLHLAAPSSLRLAHRSLDAMVARRIHANLVQSGESLDHHLIDPFSNHPIHDHLFYIAPSNPHPRPWTKVTKGCDRLQHTTSKDQMLDSTFARSASSERLILVPNKRVESPALRAPDELRLLGEGVLFRELVLLRLGGVEGDLEERCRAAVPSGEFFHAAVCASSAFTALLRTARKRRNRDSSTL
jgi:hypothetical protein